MKKKEQITQLNFFTHPKTETDFLWEAISALKESHNNVRKKLFGEISDLKNSLIEAKAQNERLIIIFNHLAQQ